MNDSPAAKEKPLTILTVEDDEGDAVVLERNLAAIPDLEFHVVRAADAQCAIQELSRGDVDLTILDYRLGAKSGLDVLERIQAFGDRGPVLVLSGCADAYAASQLVRAGADEYLSKDDLNPQRLKSAMDSARARALERRIEQRVQTGKDRIASTLAHDNVELAIRSRADALTGLLNRAAWAENIAAEHERAVRYGRVYSVLMIDVDHFKDYNDSLGHPAGDACLRKIAQALLDSCRAPDLVGRYGGEEFVIFAPETSTDAAMCLAERVRKAVVDLHLSHPSSPVAKLVTVSIGVATSPADTWEEIVQHADEALYLAKALGRNLARSAEGHSARAEIAQDRTVNILAIDDDRGDAELLRRHLDKVYAGQYRFTYAASAGAGCAELAKGGVDMVFLDYRLGAESAVDTLLSVRALGYLGPIVVVTGQGDEYTVADLMRAGADDYVAKSDLSPALLQRAMQNAENQQRRRQAEARIRELLAELHSAKKSLEAKNHRLAELYKTAHQFVDNVSHEFRTPLTVIREFASIIREGIAGQVQPQQREYLDIVLNRADDLNTMVDDMLDISRLEAGMLGVCRRSGNLGEVIEKVRTTLERKAAAAKVELIWKIPNDLPEVYCDPEKIGRVIINLTVNALKFCNEGGHVSVSAAFAPGEPFVRVDVRDDGPGIAPENLELIFDRFKQVEGAQAKGSTKGFGLGLSIARQLVHLNLGDISVQSAVGKGSTFCFTVPTADPIRIAEAYLQTIGPESVSLLTAEATGQAAAGDLDGLDEFLGRQLRSGDLLLRSQPNRWLILAATHPGELPKMTARLESAREEANRNRPAETLPALRLDVRGTWQGPEQRRELMTALERQLRPVRNDGGRTST